jgi:hypothetical protein
LLPLVGIRVGERVAAVLVFHAGIGQRMRRRVGASLWVCTDAADAVRVAGRGRGALKNARNMHKIRGLWRNILPRLPVIPLHVILYAVAASEVLRASCC